MSTRYKHGDIVPSAVLWLRLDTLAETIAGSGENPHWEREFTMSIPAELDRDADLVMAEAGKRLRDMVPRPADKWHEDDGECIWFKHPADEPPYVGQPLDSEWTENYYTHFIPLRNWMFEVSDD